ncbi:hypothetical protein BS47DRAFT_1382900 [Hydnum rufescens UP504]|uniref:Uncharacterized protein n=1 Tax=Hydnum rufescens UP504 TaxID=1448309 RepID=A0A9P6AV43_9AGAM|nr:hypothetical protein BS47DRAFT_1382900 [Hydnum rufescens UP504]
MHNHDYRVSGKIVSDRNQDVIHREPLRHFSPVSCYFIPEAEDEVTQQGQGASVVVDDPIEPTSNVTVASFDIKWMAILVLLSISLLSIALILNHRKAAVREAVRDFEDSVSRGMICVHNAGLVAERTRNRLSTARMQRTKSSRIKRDELLIGG